MKDKVTNILVEGFAWLMTCVLIGFILFFLFGCTKTEYITVEKVRTDTAYISKLQRDSVWLHDSVFVTEKGDTVRIEKWHTKYVEKLLHDTAYVAAHDTVPKPYPVVKEVPADLSWWQKIRLILGDFVLLAVLCLLVYWGIRFYKVYKVF